MSTQPEMMDIIDENDNVVGTADKSEIYKKNLRHRTTHIMIFNDKGKMALQFRGKKCSFCPEHWSTPVGGHVQSGETYEEGALREYKEELGKTGKLKFIAKAHYSAPDTPNKIFALFETKYNGPFELEEGKVDKVEFFSLKKIQEMIDRGEKFHPKVLFILRKYYGIK